MNTQKPYIGIDYGHGISNIDLQSGIHYGVISLNNVNQDWLNEFEAHYPEITHNSSCTNHDNCYCSEYLDPTHYTYNQDGLICEYSHDSSMNILFIFKSPIIVKAKFCSPCVPGAGDLDNLSDNGVNTYGLPNDCLDKE